MRVQKPQRVAQAIPPEVDTEDRSDDRIHVVNIGADDRHLGILIYAELYILSSASTKYWL
jgi:hypothetical protein